MAIDIKIKMLPGHLWLDTRLKFWNEITLPDVSNTSLLSPDTSIGFLPVYRTIKDAKDAGVPRKYLWKRLRKVVNNA